MYWTIWTALALFVAGDVGRVRRHRWGWWAWAIGVTLISIHVILAMAVAHGWSHASAVAATAKATSAVYGVDWGGGVYANYLFIAVWLAETIAWRADPTAVDRRSPWLQWTLRAFYLVMILNAAVVFVPSWRKWFGVAIVATLLWNWVAGDIRRS